MVLRVVTSVGNQQDEPKDKGTLQGPIRQLEVPLVPLGSEGDGV